MKRVVLSCRTLAHSKKDGIGVYSKELFQALTRLNCLSLSIQEISFKKIALGFLNVPMTYGEKNLDLLHVTDYLIPRTKKVPLIATLHDAIPLQYPEWVSMRYRKLKNHILASSTKFLSHVIALSYAVIPDLVTYWNVPLDKISVVYSGVSKKWFESVDENTRKQILQKYCINKKYLLFVGTFQPRKNIVRMLQAYQQLPHAIKDEYQFILIGQSGWRNDEIMKTIKSLTDNNQGKWLNYVPPEELFTLYQCADMFMFPTLYEGFGLPILEAFASKVPVITSNISSMPEISGGAALTVNPYCVDEISHAIVRFTEDRLLREACIEKGLARAQQFTWESCAENTLKVYRKFLAD